MNKRRRAISGIALGIAAVLLLPASFAQVQLKVIVSGGFADAYRQAIPEFERTTGITVTATSGSSQGNGPNTIGAELGRGVPADVVMMSKEGLAELARDGKIVAGTNVDLARTPVGVSVRAGAPKPDIGTVRAFKQALLHAKSVTIPSSTVGIYLTAKLFPRLGIAKQMAAKTTYAGANAVAGDGAELAIRPVSELLHVSGIDFVGTIPAQVQYISVFSAAVVASSKEQEASKKLIAFFASENAAGAIRNSGMEPLRLR